MVAIASWGRLSHAQHRAVYLRDRNTLPQQLAARDGPAITHGMGRSYGDQALNPGGELWMTRALNRFIRFDQERGVLECESGVLLRDIQRLALSRGWMLPVTPGTWFVTVGGAIANDVHGKNHHARGTFAEHVLGLTLVRTDGSTLRCGADERSDWFAATAGGLGLTGVIATAELQLRRVSGPWLSVETIPFSGLAEFFHQADQSEADWEYTVAWIDCLSGDNARGIFLRANHSEENKKAAAEPGRPFLPFTPPVSLVNPVTLKPFNALYYARNSRRAGLAQQHYIPFFYPLDAIGGWNRMYGPRGFFQYQCLVPNSEREQLTASLLKEIKQSGEGSFLAVLKTFGARHSPGLLSFPMPGVTLALDFPNRGETTLELMQRLDSVVGEAGGRVYAAKDARMSKAMFEQGYPRLAQFLPFRDPGLSSALSRRLLGS